MVGIRLIIIMAIVGGFIAYLADKMGSKIGKKRMSVFGLRPKHTSVLLTVASGVIISVLTIGVMAIASDSARTALFGMDKLQKELKQLNEDKLVASAALDEAKGKVNEQNETIKKLDQKITESTKENDAIEAKLAEINRSYAQAQAEVENLTQAKAELSNDVNELQQLAENLHKGVVAMREGQVFYRSGEVVFAGVMRSGLKHDENAAQVNWLLQNANEAALQRLKIGPQEEDKPLQAIWISKKVVDHAVETLDNSKGNLLFRIRAVANIIVGELAVCNIEIIDNQFIYSKGDLIASESFDLGDGANNSEAAIMTFLNKVNHVAVQAGVLPDPLTGKVGSLDAATMLEAGSAIRRIGGRFKITAYAKEDITTAGPVRVKLEVRPLEQQ